MLASSLSLSIVVMLQVLPWENRYLLPEGGSVVEARVEAVTPGSEKWQDHTATVRVTHVYAGPARLDKAFHLRTDNIKARFGPPIVEPRLGVGETLLCVVQKQRDSDTEIGSHANWYFGRGWPVRKGRDLWYDESLALAKKLGEYEKLSDADAKLKLLEEAARAESLDRSCWGMTMLGKLAPQDARAFRLLNTLVDDARIPMEGQIALDHALLAIPEARWRTSEARVAMLKRCARREGATKEDAQRFYSHMNLIAQSLEHWSPKPDRLAAIHLETVVAGKFPIETVRAQHYYALRWICDRTEDDSSVYQYVLDVLKKAEDPQIREGAIGLVGCLRELSDKRKAELREAVLTYPDLREELEAAIARQAATKRERDEKKQ
jgi:hypothetical protein